MTRSVRLLGTRLSVVAFALVSVYLVVSMAPIAAAATGDTLVVGSEHTTDVDFSGATTENLSVGGSGEGAYVTVDSSGGITSQTDSFDDGSFDTSKWSFYNPGGGASYVEQSGYLELQNGPGDDDRAYVIADKINTDGSNGGDITISSTSRTTGSGGQINHLVWWDGQSHGDFESPNNALNLIIRGFDNEVNVQKYEGGTGTVIESKSLSVDETQYHDWRLEVTGTFDDFTYKVYRDDTLVMEGSGTYSPTQSAPYAGYANRERDANTRFDEATIQSGGEEFNTGKYISPTHNVDSGQEAHIDVTESTNVSYTVTPQYYDGSSWVNATDATYSSAGEKTVSLPDVASSQWRTRIDVEATGDNPAWTMADESIWFTDNPATASSPNLSGGDQTNNENVDLSVDVSDPQFGMAQGESVTVDFYVDGAQIDTQTISSNGTVSTTATGLSDGNHTWHVEMADSYGVTSNSSTWDFEVNHYAAVVDNASASPQGGQQFNNENIQASVNITDRDFAEPSGDTVTVDFYVDGTQTDSTTISSNGTVSFNATNLDDGAHTWHVETTDEYGLTSSSSTFDFEVNHYAPIPDSANATPTDGSKETTREVTFSVPVNDTDFAETSGDEVQATFYLDGSSFTTKNITANGTVSASTTISVGGEHTWHVELVDEYGLTAETDADPNTAGSQSFTFASPSTLYIYNESDTSQLIDTAEVELRFYGATNTTRIYERTTSDGEINMTGLPIDEEFIVIARADGYLNRRIYVRSLYEQSRVYLLPENKTSVYNVFTLVDRSGEYPAGSTRLIIQRGLNVSGELQWQTVAGDFFGATNEFPIYLRYNQRYQLVVENDAGNRRDIGAYVAADENNPKPIVIKSIVVDPPEGQQYYGTAWVEDPTDNDGEETFRFTYSDPKNETESLSLVVHERGNKSHEIINTTVTDVGTAYAYSYTLDESRDEYEKAWQVTWSADRGGDPTSDTAPGGTFPVGQTGTLIIPFDPDWAVRFSLVALVITGALASERIATYGALGVVVLAGLLMVTGIWEIPVSLWVAAVVIALGGHMLAMAKRGSVFG